jgi:hypothetical protein
MYECTFLGKPFYFSCPEHDYKFWINHLTMIEMFGQEFHTNFNNIRYSMTVNSYPYDENIYISITQHINKYLIAYQRDININKLIKEENDNGSI